MVLRHLVAHMGDAQQRGDPVRGHTGRQGKPAAEPKKGLAKILAGCAIAKSDGYSYIWIDYCCIDKSSSSELSEAINSMFE